MTWSRDEVLRKVRALLRLAEGNACEAEAEAAMTKVRRLLREHDLTLSEAEIERDPAGVELAASEDLGRAYVWIWMLAGVVARVTSTKALRQQYRRRGRAWSQRMIFVGTSVDAAAAAALFNYLHGTIKIMAGSAVSGAVGRNSFCLGVAMRLRARAELSLCQEAEAGAGTTAIVLAKDRAIEQYMGRLGAIKHLPVPRAPEIDGAAFDAGVRAAERLPLSRPDHQLAVQGVLL